MIAPHVESAFITRARCDIWKPCFICELRCRQMRADRRRAGVAASPGAVSGPVPFPACQGEAASPRGKAFRHVRAPTPGPRDTSTPGFHAARLPFFRRPEVERKSRLFQSSRDRAGARFPNKGGRGIERERERERERDGE